MKTSHSKEALMYLLRNPSEVPAAALVDEAGGYITEFLPMERTPAGKFVCKFPAFLKTFVMADVAVRIHGEVAIGGVHLSTGERLPKVTREICVGETLDFHWSITEDYGPFGEHEAAVGEIKAAHALLDKAGIQDWGGDEEGNEFALKLDERIQLLIDSKGKTS